MLPPNYTLIIFCLYCCFETQVKDLLLEVRGVMMTWSDGHVFPFNDPFGKEGIGHRYQRPVMKHIDVFFVVSQNNIINKQHSSPWSEAF